MKALLCLVLFIFFISAGCAPGYKSMTKAQGEKEWQELMQEDPGYYHIWAEESGR